MNIGLDVRLLESHRPGVNRYVHNLLEALARVDRENRYLCLAGKGTPFVPPAAGNFRLVTVPAPWPQPLNTLLDFFRPAGMDRLDLLHCFFPLAPLFPRAPLVVTLHDFQPVLVPLLRGKHPEYRSGRGFLHQQAIDRFYRFTYFRSLKQAGLIICISRHTEERLKQLLPEAAPRSRVVYYGIEGKFRPPAGAEELRAVREKYILPPRFIFYAGTNRPNKNLPRLLEAVRIMRGMPGVGGGLRLVLAGFEHPAYPSSAGLAASLGISDIVRHIGEVPHDELPAIYSLAEAAVLVSFLEGFGFPPLEAMACGTPAVIGRDSSLPEVAADAGVLVDPADSKDIARGLALLWTDPEARRKYSRLGLERARIFDWDYAARQTLSVYEEFRPSP